MLQAWEAKTHGGYVSECQLAKTATVVRSPEGQKAQKRLWDELMVRLEKIEPGASENFVRLKTVAFTCVYFKENT